MQKRFYLDTNNLVRINKKIFNILACGIFFVSTVVFAGDVPIERDFLRLPDQRWIWLKKVGWHSTKIILGKGKKSLKNKIWSEVYETDGNRHSWADAFFVKISPHKFITFDANHHPQVGVSTYDMGTGVIRWAIIFRVKNNRLEIVDEVDEFNVAADESIYH